MIQHTWVPNSNYCSVCGVTVNAFAVAGNPPCPGSLIQRAHIWVTATPGSGHYECQNCGEKWVGYATYPPCTALTPPMGVPIQDPFDFGDSADATEPPTQGATTATCISCDRELSSTLDSYYGKDPYQAKQCRPCREARP